ncbi:hypothetical protein PVK06_003065 [Gossypium arboreum]|uniref:Uncharacterized protein n=1 Tax=Gossypium arboreum TaxID=29729 RepID=A0ABR0R6D0_GOSAR|nr:hypothetical protein PVK06_003065 [Gossypium arboreum]
MLFLTETAEKILVCCVLLKLKLILVLGSRLAKKFKFEASFEVAANDIRIDIVLASYYDQFTGIVWNIPNYPLPSFGWKYSFEGLFCLCTTVSYYRRSVLDRITEFCNTKYSPMNIMGEFNDFASFDEREGGIGNGVERMIQFKERWSMCNLMDRVPLN